MYTSEAQAYQAIRREWKLKLERSQRAVSLSQWELHNQDVHPQIKRITMSTLKVSTPIEDFHMPVLRPETLKRTILNLRLRISKYQLLLNKYKIKDQ